MSTVEERIAALEDEINGYKIQLNIAIANNNDEKRIFFGGLIKTRGNNLHDLTQQLLQQQSAVQSNQQSDLMIPVIDERRKRRWDSLNNVLNINNKAKRNQREDGLPSVGYSYVSWGQVENIFPVVSDMVGPVSTPLPEPMLDALSNYLSWATLCFGSITEGHEAKRVHFIAPIIIIVCANFNGDIQILAEEDIQGNRVHAHSHFEFVLKRGDKRICIVEAKKDDLLQGKTQCLIGCESLCDVENLDITYGIATNYLSWVFLKNEANQITEEIKNVDLDNNKPTKASLHAIANKIISILS